MMVQKRHAFYDNTYPYKIQDWKRDGNLIRRFIKRYCWHSNQLIYEGEMCMYTFGGQFCRFRARHLDDGRH
ncbi:hypothetical protein GALMADRAFT_892227 [Galerina marginata CBS 339.88]|uniref:Uncharacterized protein n=1 Tax=Galerina marginata (strain CBS 339.88) TaxID=685588 RepID=A0A067SR91_GALM3|nr:hypothetical protein GALMADRAFT_892227 [Galerina marginata CBS 339.88]